MEPDQEPVIPDYAHPVGTPLGVSPAFVGWGVFEVIKGDEQ